MAIGSLQFYTLIYICLDVLRGIDTKRNVKLMSENKRNRFVCFFHFRYLRIKTRGRGRRVTIFCVTIHHREGQWDYELHSFEMLISKQQNKNVKKYFWYHLKYTWNGWSIVHCTSNVKASMVIIIRHSKLNWTKFWARNKNAIAKYDKK